MFALQKRIHESLPEMMEIWGRYQRNKEELLSLSESVKNFKVRMPLIGAFSAGKSSVLNALLGEELLSVSVNPETTLATEIYYGEREEIKGHYPDGRVKALTREIVRTQDYGSLVPSGWVEIKLASPVLAAIPHVCLVDMPGLASGNETHAKAIDNYIRNSLAYCVVISIEDGTLSESTRQFLQELAIHRSPVLVVLTKSDKRPESAMAGVAAQIGEQAKKLLGDSPFELITVSSRKKELASLVNALGKLEQKAEQRFKETVGWQVANMLAALVQDMDVLINKDDLNSEQLQVKLQEQEREMQQFRENLDRETSVLETQIEPAVRNIAALVESRLRAETDSLARSAMNGVDLNGEIGQTVRLAVAEGIRNDFLPKVKKYLNNVEAELPEGVVVNGSFQAEKSQAGSDGWDIASNAVTLVGSLALRAIPWMAIALPIIKGLVDWFISEKRKEDEAARRLEAAKEHVLASVIPAVISQVKDNLQKHLQEQVEAARQAIRADVEARNDQHKATIAALEKTLLEGQAEFAKAREGFQADQAWAQQLLQQVRAA
jgi:GTP-binding protein EngB required for normal cell division